MTKGIQRVGFLGLGKSNLSLLNLDRFSGCKITLRSKEKIDFSALSVGLNIERAFIGNDQLSKIDEEYLFLSPSVRRDIPELKAAATKGVILTSDHELFFKENRAPLYAVTGSDGKSTTSTLVSLLLRAAGEKCGLIGNIGEAMVKNLGKYDCYVSELSSFMLQYSAPKAKRACITNITPNHLDWHSSFEEYKEAKLRILKNANEWVLPEELGDGFAVIGSDLQELKKRRKAEVYITAEGGFIKRNGERIISIESVKRNEAHNIKNLMMAIGMTDGKVGHSEILSVAESFSGLAHRCELFLSRNGIDYYDSSIDSTPERTAQTLSSLGRRCVLILGGRSKGLDYRTMRPAVDKYAEKILICGENAEEIFKAIRRSDAYVLDDFQDTVMRGIELAVGVGTLLLSPASTSYDRFKNFADRGDNFKEIIKKSIF